MSWADFWMFTAEMPGREDPLRFEAEAFKYSQDEQAIPRSPDMPGTYGDRNNETTGAVTAS
jgi:hypothetical protein